MSVAAAVADPAVGLAPLLGRGRSDLALATLDDVFDAAAETSGGCESAVLVGLDAPALARVCGKGYAQAVSTGDTGASRAANDLDVGSFDAALPSDLGRVDRSEVVAPATSPRRSWPGSAPLFRS